MISILGVSYQHTRVSIGLRRSLLQLDCMEPLCTTSGVTYHGSYRLDRPFPCKQSEIRSTGVQEGDA